MALFYSFLLSSTLLSSDLLADDFTFSYRAKRGNDRRGRHQLLASVTNLITFGAHSFLFTLLLHLYSACHPLFFCIQFSSVAQSCPTLCDPMNCSMPGLPVHHQLPESTQTRVQWVGDAIQPSHPLSSPSPPALNLAQHQGLSQWVSSSHQVAKVLEFQLQHQSFQWTPRIDLL